MNGFNFKALFATFFVVTLVLISQVYNENLKEILKLALESNLLTALLWSYVVGVFLIHKFLYFSNSLQKNSFIYKHFGPYSDAFLGIATNGLAGSTSLSLIKGLFLQTFYAGSYFSGFGAFDLSSMFVMASFLLYYSVFNTTVLFKEIAFYFAVTPIEIKK
jgi:hypothetical protein